MTPALRIGEAFVDFAITFRNDRTSRRLCVRRPSLLKRGFSPRHAEASQRQSCANTDVGLGATSSAHTRDLEDRVGDVPHRANARKHVVELVSPP